MTAAPRHTTDTAHPVPALLAILLPGLGHFALGERRRAAMICAGVLGLFFGGILIGGIGVIDKKEDFWWFVGQACVGPVAFGADWVHQNRFKVVDPATGRRITAPPPPDPDAKPAYSKPIGRMHEIGALYAALAGLLNLIAVIDAGWRPPRSHRQTPGTSGSPGSPDTPGVTDTSTARPKGGA